MSHFASDIDFEKIRPLNGRRSEGFEELACQLAALEERPEGSEFIRKGKGRDAGLECFVRFSDGAEHGWQVKYSWEFDANLKRSLDKSIDAALSKHPALTRITVCLPFDLSDARGKKETPRQAYDNWRDDRIAQAVALGRTLEIDLWGASELGIRLTSDDPRRAGRLLYWFGTKYLTRDWFAQQYDRVRNNLGSRYTAETNVKLPVRRALLGLSRNPELLRKLAEYRGELRKVAHSLNSSCNLNEEQSATIDAAARSLDAVEDLGAGPWPINRWKDEAEAALEVVRDRYRIHLKAKREAFENAGKAPPDKNAEAALRRALDVLGGLLEQLSEPVWAMADTGAVLVTGEAGAGKSHLLADACAGQLDQDRPALLFMGSSLTETEVWPQLITQLDLPADYRRDTLLGALDTAGEAAGVRTLLMIDAINEHNGSRIWPDRLGAFLADVKRFPHVAAVLSCRSTYLSQVVPDSLGDHELPRLDHAGFSLRDARAFLKLRGFVLTDHPFLDPEFHNPLVLKTCCDALESEGKTRFPKGIRGASSVFDMFRNAACRAIELRLGVSSRRRFPERAIDALAQEIERTRETYIPYDRAAEIVDTIYGGSGRHNDDLLFQLESEGVIAFEPVAGDEGLEGHVRFTFERFADHVVARAIVENTLVDGQLPDPLPAESLLVNACSRDGVDWGVREALAVQVPERTGAELPDVLSPFEEAETWGLVTPETVRMRAPESIGERTLELLGEMDGVDAVRDALVRLSIEPEGPFDAYSLHASLSEKSMPERDGKWSIFVAENGDDADDTAYSAIRDLIEWARDVRVGEVEPETASLAAIALTWCLTTSNRRARDTATMGLVSLLAAAPDVVGKLLELFDGVDDPYVGERLAAAIYGAALQGTWNEQELERIAGDITERFFVRGPLPVDMLWRDHLSSLLHYAENRGCTDFVPNGVNFRAPFDSPWPLEPVTDEEIEGYTRTYRSGFVSTDEIVSSTGEYGDFARYVIQYSVDDWSPAARDAPSLPTAEDLYYAWKAEFDSYATPEMVDAFDAMNAVRDEGREWMYASGQQAEKHKRLEREFRLAIGSERFERYRVMARHWRPGADWGGSTSRPAYFNQGWAQRWICKRAHELGWREDLHGAFDMTCTHDRHDHRRERIGKKYQWIALRELMARISDNCAATDGDWQRQYRETVRRLRDVDPSCLIEGSHDWGWARFHDETFWMPHVLKPAAMSLPEAWEWLDGERDFLDGSRFIDLMPDDSGERWLPLGGFQRFDQHGTTAETEPIGRETWLHLDCLVVRAADEAAALDRLKNKILLGSDALGLDHYDAAGFFFGEHGWRNRSGFGWTKEWGRDYDAPAVVKARGTTCQFRQETGGHDHSLTQNVDVRLPAPWLMEALQLRLADGRDVRYVDQTGRTLFFDPSIQRAGRSTALVQREAFLAMCEREGLSPIWVLGGAKEVDVQDRQTYGERSFTSVYTIINGRIERQLHTTKAEERREEDEGFFAT